MIELPFGVYRPYGFYDDVTSYAFCDVSYDDGG